MANEDKKILMLCCMIIGICKKLKSLQTRNELKNMRIFCRIVWCRFYRINCNKDFCFYCGMGSLSVFQG